MREKTTCCDLGSEAESLTYVLSPSAVPWNAAAGLPIAKLDLSFFTGLGLKSQSNDYSSPMAKDPLDHWPPKATLEIG
jgi:hypothetical protein